ncbi:GatB/YqeY domain-containing protein [Neolewinella lacunae]|uniref:GatB/YqeY domain-containing protein n=1 Tax=Neolewinella lacunae TaxID=1517758 RepID=A0A923TEX9_9BACT|nr:GatB/YqeY domain-containing protein [Neolewinella lacunae]MBC6996402.1 GatB/YqeY domain-containing protein [Neolewinella lacunae]MDN3633655.1 GatB/YqeY domain-containing protein [Neolewinella lacunae]
MTLEERITTDLKTAMKAQDKIALRGIRAIKSAILLQKTDGTGQALDAEGEIALLQKLVKSRQDSLDIYVKQNREDLAVTEREEIEVISRYLPEALSEEELAALIDGIIAENGATSMKDMGKVMGLANKAAAGRADGKTIAAMVKQKLG